jgi:hypothetical protein
MITEDEIDQAVAVIEDPTATPLAKRLAEKLVDAWIRQENQTMEFLDLMYRGCRDRLIGSANSA